MSQIGELFAFPEWQMVAGERAAFEGILSFLRPQLAIEIGTAGGGSLRRLAAHAAEVHSFDLTPPATRMDDLDNVTFHTGDSHRLLPAVLAELSRKARNVDFVLVDGDHTSDGVRQDLEDLLRSAAVASTTILLHDTSNPEVRAGIERARPEQCQKVCAVELDLVPGYLVRAADFHHELWGGLGVVIVGAEGPPSEMMHLSRHLAYPAADVLADYRAKLVRAH